MPERVVSPIDLVREAARSSVSLCTRVTALSSRRRSFWLAGDPNDGCGTPIAGDGAEWDSAQRGAPSD
jgi:hypothetical protein